MNPDRPDRDDVAKDLAGWLPTPAERDIPPGRAQVLKEHLMTEIQTDSPRPATRRRRRMVVLVPTLGAVTAAVVALVTVVATHGGAGHPTTVVAGQPTPHGGEAAGPPTTGPAVTLLARVATVADRQPAPAVRDDQYEYVATTVVARDAPIVSSDGKVSKSGALEPPHLRQIWQPVADLCRPGLIREEGQDTPTGKENLVDVTCPYAGYLNFPSYRLLASLPTDPRALLNRIYKEEKGHGPDPDSEAFTTIGDLLRESVTPPALSAALYRAAALIPGVRVVDDATDAAGRHGIAVTRDSQGQRAEWIFDRATLLQIGERELWASGELIDSTAIMAKAIVNHLGDTQ